MSDYEPPLGARPTYVSASDRIGVAKGIYAEEIYREWKELKDGN